MSLLKPLLLDVVPSIQQSVTLAVGRLASYSEDLAQSVADNDIIPQLMYSLPKQNRSTLSRTCAVCCQAWGAAAYALGHIGNIMKI